MNLNGPFAKLLFSTLGLLRGALRRFQAICFFVGIPLGLLLWIGGSMLDWLNGPSELLGNLLLIGLLGALASFLFVGLQPKVDRWIELGMAATLPIRRGPSSLARPEVLYLRPFRFDSWTVNEFSSLEEFLLGRLPVPVLAVSNPTKEEQPYVGAARVKLELGDAPSTEWRSHVKQLVVEARLVIMVFDDSSGLVDELAIANEVNALAKTALVMPRVDHFSWSVLLTALPDKAILECLRHCPPSASVQADFSRVLETMHLSRVNVVSRTSGMIDAFRDSVSSAKNRIRGTMLDVDKLECLVKAGCPAEMMLLIHGLVSQNISGITFGRHFRLWARPRRRTWGRLDSRTLMSFVISLYRQIFVVDRGSVVAARDLGQMVLIMVDHLSRPPSSSSA